jgi:inner membrane protein
MPTIFSHAVVGTALGQWYSSSRLPMRFWLLTAFCAMAPDLDVIGFAFGVRYDDLLGHRGITHSLSFAVAAGFVAARVCLRSPASNLRHRSLEVGRWPLGAAWLFFSLVTASHGLLDAMTDGGRGIALLAPFHNDRYFFPWRPILVSPIGVGFFSVRGLTVLANEARWIVLPSAIIALIARAVRKPARQARVSRSL